MFEQIIEIGDKVHVITRRQFPEDYRRDFVAEVTRASGDVCRVQGFTFVFNAGVNEYQKRLGKRTRIFSLSDANHVVNLLPPEVEIDALEYRMVEKRVVVTDSKKFSLDIDEFGHAT